VRQSPGAGKVIDRRHGQPQQLRHVLRCQKPIIKPIERLGKNVIGFRTAMLKEDIMPFVCFGYGCDFEEQSSILDRVVTIAMFGPPLGADAPRASPERYTHSTPMAVSESRCPAKNPA
jgi:hypothetical protein